MGIGTGTAMLIGGGVAAAGSVASGVMGANAAQNAASTQANAADYAAQLQAQTANNNLLYQGALSNAEIANEQPWYQSGVGALSQLDQLMGITPGAPAQGVNVPSLGIGTIGQPGTVPSGTYQPQSTNGAQYKGFNGLSSLTPATAGTPAASGGQPQGATPSAYSGKIATDAYGNPTGGAATTAPLMQGWNQTFQSPTAVTEQNDPGYQFRMQQGANALNMGAAASGNLLSAGTENALQQYGQNFGSNEYQNVYNRALQNYDTNFNTFQTNQTNQYNRLAAMAGMGQVSAQQLNSGLANSGNNVSYIMGNAANNIGQQANNAAAATASGYIGSANAYGNMFNSLGQLGSQYAMYNAMMNNNGGGSGGGGSNMWDPWTAGMAQTTTSDLSGQYLPYYG